MNGDKCIYLVTGILWKENKVLLTVNSVQIEPWKERNSTHFYTLVSMHTIFIIK